MLREPQHERKIMRCPPFVPSSVEGFRESFQQPLKFTWRVSAKLSKIIFPYGQVLYEERR
jgi:hypothetical protein